MLDIPPEHVVGTRRVGRPRSPDADSAILGAAVLLLSESGFQGMTMDQVARRAGVGRTTVYRRWRTKEDMISKALAGLVADFDVQVSGDLRADLFFLTRWLVDGLLNSPMGRLVPQLAAQMISDPDFPENYMDTWVCPWREAAQRAFSRGQEEGMVRTDADLTAAVDLLAGVVILRLFLGKCQPMTDEQVENIVSLILEGALVRNVG
jgi:AcrR family transcriptional regulator